MRDAILLRPARHDDTDAIRAIALYAGMFTLDDIGDFDDVLTGHLDESEDGHVWVVAERTGTDTAAGHDTARVIIVETSNLEGYDGACAFYRAHGYDEEARIREYYGPGDDKIVFWKSLTSADDQRDDRTRDLSRHADLRA